MEKLEVEDLTEEEVKIVKEFIDLLKARRVEKPGEGERIALKAGP